MRDSIKMPLGLKACCFVGFCCAFLSALLSIQRSNTQNVMVSLVTFILISIFWILIKSKKPSTVRFLFGLFFISSLSASETLIFAIASGAKITKILEYSLRFLIAMTLCLYLYKKNVIEYFNLDFKKVYARSRWILGVAFVSIFVNGVYVYVNVPSIKKDAEDLIQQIDALKEDHFRSKEPQETHSEKV